MQIAGSSNFDHYPLLDNMLVDQAYKTMGGKFARLVEYYLEDTASYVLKIHDAIVENDPIAMIPPAHIAKSASRQLGTMRLAELIAHIETTGRSVLRGETSIIGLAQALPELQATFDKTKHALECLLRDMKAK